MLSSSHCACRAPCAHVSCCSNSHGTSPHANDYTLDKYTLVYALLGRGGGGEGCPSKLHAPPRPAPRRAAPHRPLPRPVARWARAHDRQQTSNACSRPARRDCVRTVPRRAAPLTAAVQRRAAVVQQPCSAVQQPCSSRAAAVQQPCSAQPQPVRGDGPGGAPPQAAGC